MIKLQHDQSERLKLQYDTRFKIFKPRFEVQT